MNFKESLQYLDNFSNYEKKAHELKARFTLSQIRALMRKSKHPERQYPSVHIAGTVGKGSVCHILEAALVSAGFRTGLYTSPHILDIRERIRINGRMIGKSAFADSVANMKTAAGEDYGKYTYFEMLTAVALRFFADSNIDIAIIETGLGGRLDATNIVPPFISVLTPIGWDHQHVLGSTLSEIAAEKAGIIKRGSSVVSAPQKTRVFSVIENTCTKKNAVFFPVDANVIIKPISDSSRLIVNLDYTDAFEILLPLEGLFQRQNLAVAMKTMEVLSQKGFHADSESIRRGVETMRFLGRMERIQMKSGQGEYLLDGAHNQPAAQAFAKHVLISEAKNKDIVLIVGMMQDKDAGSIFKELCKISKKIILCGLPYERAFDVVELGKIAQRFFTTTYLTKNVRCALKIARKLSNKGDLICITGSFYAVSQAKETIQRL